MPEERTLPISAEHREFVVTSDGDEIAREHQLLGVHITTTVNRIASARLVYLDGAASSSDFPLSGSELFVPGREVTIAAGAGDDRTTLFRGIVVAQRLKVREASAPQLVVECRHAATKLTVGRRDAYYLDQSDSDVIEGLLAAAGITADVESTSPAHPHLVQYGASDWDFLLARADANGLLVRCTVDGVEVKPPALDAEPVATLQFGSTLLELDAEIDARSQYAAVVGRTWDPAQQEVVEREAENPSISTPGNLESATLAEVIGLERLELEHPAIGEEEAQAWADGAWRRSQMNRVGGRAKCEGIGTVRAGDIVQLDGLGERFNGRAFVSGVRHDFDLVQGWRTHVQFGGIEAPSRAADAVSAPAAAALVPAVSGLQIGIVVSNEDPAGEHRVRVRMPLVSADSDGAWARVASIDAGDNRGMFIRPEIGDEVVLGFLADDPRHPVVLGMLNSSAKPAPLGGSDDNHEKVFQSRSGMMLYFNDDTKVMRLETPAGNRIALDEAETRIRLEDQNGNSITLDEEGITIESSKALTLKSATETAMESGTSLGIKGGTDVKMEGSSGAEVSSSGATKIKGSMVQLN